ncbi:glycosyltransferase family 4 protein [Salipiger marinus]|uniref:glycosyltransferase family 4 protein n=1 Tax=Salipiger marinus TaxID=555512 RepID=UPI004057E447
MRMAYIARSVLPSEAANAVHVARMCAALAGEGADLRLFAHQGRPESDMAGLAQIYGLRHPFALRLYDMKHPLDRLGWRARALLQAWREGRRAVLTRDVPTAALATRWGFATVLELHHPPAPDSDKGRALARAQARGARLVAITAQLAAHLEAQLNLPAGAVTVLQDGADLAPEPAPPPPGRRLVAGYAGSLLPGKGVELIAALAPLVPEVAFVVLGGPETARRDWQARVSAPNLSFLPRVAPAEVARHIAGFDVALLPNARRVGTSGGGVTDIGAWTSPLKAFEYMALGRAILASDLPNLREVFSDRRNALLCPPEDPEGWVAPLRALAADAGLRARLGDAARQDLAMRYSWAARARAMLTLLAQRP